MQDHELINRIRRGERDLFGELADRYYSDVFRYCYYQTGDEQAAWDCTQETFYRLLRFLDHYTERNRFKAWLLRIALNICRDYFRKSGRELSYESCFEDSSGDKSAGRRPKVPPLSLPSPEGRAETGILVQEALNRLPELQREAVILFYYYGYRQREIASITGAPLSTVKTRLRAGVERLQEDFRGQGLL